MVGDPPAAGQPAPRAPPAKREEEEEGAGDREDGVGGMPGRPGRAGGPDQIDKRLANRSGAELVSTVELDEADVDAAVGEIAGERAGPVAVMPVAAADHHAHLRARRQP